MKNHRIEYNNEPLATNWFTIDS